MTEPTAPVAPSRVGDGSREFLFAWVFFGAGLFAAAASAWGAPLAGPFSSLCLVIGFIWLAAGLSKRLAWQLEQRLIDIETALKRPPGRQGEAAYIPAARPMTPELRSVAETAAVPAEERAIGPPSAPLHGTVDAPTGRA